MCHQKVLQLRQKKTEEGNMSTINSRRFDDEDVGGRCDSGKDDSGSSRALHPADEYNDRDQQEMRKLRLQHITTCSYRK
ncbi:hypothetical protein CHUAL_010343 [Chamberlinius hualienensis]